MHTSSGPHKKINPDFGRGWCIFLAGANQTYGTQFFGAPPRLHPWTNFKFEDRNGQLCYATKYKFFRIFRNSTNFGRTFFPQTFITFFLKIYYQNMGNQLPIFKIYHLKLIKISTNFRNFITKFWWWWNFKNFVIFLSILGDKF